MNLPKLLTKLVYVCLFLSHCPHAISQSAQVDSSAVRPEIRLPSITSRWKLPNDVEAPEISIEDLANCQFQNTEMGSQFTEIRKKEVSLDEERSKLEAQSATLRAGFSAVEVAKKNFSERVEKLNADSLALIKRSELIADKKKATLRTQADVNEFNSMVNAYNRDLLKLRSNQDSLRSDEDVLNRNLDQYNASAKALNLRAMEYSEKVAIFNKLSNDARQQAGEFAQKCVGSRRIKK
jgi:chromosome segregation ATPase